MTISRKNLRFYLSGGSSNPDPGKSLGGERSFYLVDTDLNGLFDDVTGDEAALGETEYRCIYFVNGDLDPDGLLDPVLWIGKQAENAPLLEIGVLPRSKNVVAPTIADVYTPPGEIWFVAPPSEDLGIRLPGQPYYTDDYVAIWVRRTVAAGTPPGKVNATLSLSGDTY